MQWVHLVPWGLLQPLIYGLIATFLLKPIYTQLNISSASKVRTDMQAAIQNALSFGIAKSKGSPENIMDDVELWNDLINVAKDYLNENADTLMKQLGITDSNLTKALEAQVLSAVNSFVYQNGQIKAVVADPTQATPGTNVNVTTPAAA